MPGKIKALWVVCCVFVVIGFVYLSFKLEYKNQKAEFENSVKIAKEQRKAAQKKMKLKIASSTKIKQIAELSALGKYDEAQTLAQTITREYPGSAEAYTWWGIALVKSGNRQEALEKFTKSAELDDHSARTFIYWGLTLAMEGKFQEAVPKYQRAIKIDPLNSNAFSYLGASLNRMGQYKESILKLEEALALNKFNQTAYEPLVEALYHTGEHEKAWKIVFRARKAKVELPDKLIELLSSAMAEPASQESKPG